MSERSRRSPGSGAGSSRGRRRTTRTFSWTAVKDEDLGPSGLFSNGLWLPSSRLGLFTRRFHDTSKRIPSNPKPILHFSATMQHGFCFRLAPSTPRSGRTGFSSSVLDVPIQDHSPGHSNWDREERGSSPKAGSLLDLNYTEWLNGFPKDWTHTSFVCKHLETLHFLNPRHTS